MSISHANYIDGSLAAESFGPMVPVLNPSRQTRLSEIPSSSIDTVDVIGLANDTEYGLTSPTYTTSLTAAMHAVGEFSLVERYVNRENFEAMHGFHAGVRKSGVGGADGKQGMDEYIATHIAYLQT